MTSEARLKELAAMLANHPFLALAVDEINGLEEEARSLKTLNGDLGKARDRVIARLREEEESRVMERARAEELVMAKSHELAELRERVESLEDYINRATKQLCDGLDMFDHDMRFHVENAIEVLGKAALSQANAQAKLENQEEESP